MTREEYIGFANALKNNYTIDFDMIPEFCDMAVSVLSAIEKIRAEIEYQKGKWDDTSSDTCFDIVLEIIDKHINTETWNGYHGTTTAPKGTFDRIYEECKDSEDEI